MIDKIVYRVLKVFDKNNQISKLHTGVVSQFIKFCIVGVSNIIISYFIYLFCYKIFLGFGITGKVNYLTSQLIGFVVSLFWSFYWNNRYVFSHQSEHRKLIKSFFKMVASYSFTGIILNSFLLILWIDFFNISEVFAPVINLLFSVPLNFILNKYWAFGK